MCGGICCVCRKPFSSIKNAHIDHDHAWGNVRALVHNHCNHAIGYREKLGAETWTRIDAYVKEHEKNEVP